jgi:hypothetical protein
MQYYEYDNNDFYIGNGEATPGDVPGSWIYPSRSTLVPTPTDEPGKWRRNGEAWQAVTAEESAAIARSKRDALLASSDWTQLPDSPLSGDARTAWAAYRQALRDITDQEGFPGEVDWPDAPGD